MFIVDTGASFHFGDYRQLTKKERKTIRKMAVPIRVTTANGIMEVTEKADVDVKDLNITVTVKLNCDTHFLLSVGKLVEDNCSFEWPSKGDPTLHFHDDDGDITKTFILDMMQNAPVCAIGQALCEGIGEPEAPAEIIASATSRVP